MRPFPTPDPDAYASMEEWLEDVQTWGEEFNAVWPDIVSRLEALEAAAPRAYDRERITTDLQNVLTTRHGMQPQAIADWLRDNGVQTEGQAMEIIADGRIMIQPEDYTGIVRLFAEPDAETTQPQSLNWRRAASAAWNLGKPQKGD